MVVFDPNEPIERIVARASSERTMLTQFFAMNKLHDSDGDLARTLTYVEFPQKFVWHADKKLWSRRKNGFTLGRLYFVPPTAGERFHLRTLLTIVNGPTSFEDLKTYNNVLHLTFKDACKARGLLEDDGEWRLCLRDACQTQVGSRLRHLFVTMLLFCEITSPESLWFEFRSHICDDLEFRLSNASQDLIYDYGLFLIEESLSDLGYSLRSFPHMPMPMEDWTGVTSNPLIDLQLNYNADEEYTLFEEHYKNISRIPEQLQAYTRIIDCVEKRQTALFFINGPGGTGKTYLYQTLCHKIRSERKIVLCVASSGIAALLLPGGHTAHSTFRIPIHNLDSESFCNISKQDQRSGLLRAVHLIIWDEALMHTRYAHEALDRTMRDICDQGELPFGGKPVVFGGDFQQTLPVIPRASQEEIIFHTLPRSYLWRSVEVLNLRINIRLLNNTAFDGSQIQEAEFAQWLLEVGHGTQIDDNRTITFNPMMRVRTVDQLISSIYPDIHNMIPPPQYFLDRMILAPRNTEIEQINKAVLQQMSGNEFVFYSADSVEVDPCDNDDVQNIPNEYLRSINISGLPPGELHLKLGCPLILLRNLSPQTGLCNGTRMILKNASQRVLEIQVIGGKHNGDLALIPRISLIPTPTSSLHFRLKRRQFPVQLAFALTINKSQGQTVQHVGLDLREHVFSHGQLYVALSRVTSVHRLKILIDPDSKECRIHNVVYNEIFH
jgi:hypothetical protein